MSSARSTVLGALEITDSAYHTVATCPIGYTLIVKDIRFESFATGSITMQVRLLRGTGLTVYIVNDPAQPGQTLDWQGWVVMEAGDQLIASVQAAPAAIWVSGTVLVGEAPPT